MRKWKGSSEPSPVLTSPAPRPWESLDSSVWKHKTIIQRVDVTIGQPFEQDSRSRIVLVVPMPGNQVAVYTSRPAMDRECQP